MGDGAGKTAYELGLNPRSRDLTGMQFGTLRVVRYHGQSEGRQTEWVCLCECGRIFVAATTTIRKQSTKYCPTCRPEKAKYRARTHGLSHTREHKIWAGILSRTTNSNCPEFSYYGGRGIAVCERWRQSFEAFYEDMGPSPSKTHSIDRIDNDGNYEPGNCRWATKKEQARNSRKAVLIEFNGQTKCISEWAEECGLPYDVLQARLKRKRVNIEKALTTPVRPIKKRE